MNPKPKRHRIAATITKAALALTFNLYHKFSPLLRRLFSISVRFMDSVFFSYDEENDPIPNSLFESSLTTSFSDPGESLFLVSFRWWKEAVCGSAVLESGAGSGILYSTSVQFNSTADDIDGDVMDISGFGESEILLGMRGEGEVGISGQVEERVSGEEDMALVSEWMFFTALKWHNDKKDVENSLHNGDNAHDLFSLKIKLLYMWETNLLLIKISQKDNEVRWFNRACRIFSNKSGTLHIYDFSGQTNQLFFNERKQLMDYDQSNEILLELQIYGLSCAFEDEGSSKEHMMVEEFVTDGPSPTSPLSMNGCVDKMNFFPMVQPSFSAGSGYRGTYVLGLTGLYNLGNTCFMNSAIQCLVHTSKLVDYFLGNFRKDLNYENPLGMKGKLAVVFGDLLRKLWEPRTTPISPRLFKSTVSSLAPQFSGYNQHDSQEFLAFLLDGLHEDLNRVKSKPYIQATDEDHRPDEEVANEYWENHISRNDSVIVDLYQGQYRSTLFCPVCRKLSITFDPFMYMSLPLPSSTLRKMTLTVLSTDSATFPHPVTITVSNNATFKDLVEAMGKACSLRDDETLIIAEIYNNAIFRYLDDPFDLVELIRDNDQLVAYRLPKDVNRSPLVVFMHQKEDKSPFHYFPSHKKFGIPLLTRMTDFSKGSELHQVFLELISPYFLPSEEFLNDDDASEKSAHDDEHIENIVLDGVGNLDSQSENKLDGHIDFEFHLEMEGLYSKRIKINMDEPVPISSPMKPVTVLVTWPEKMIQEYDTAILSLLPEVCKPTLLSKWTQDSVSLYKCIDAFLKEEPLGPDDMWYCPNCKEHRQASKKLDFWRLPEILVIHLKRFSYNRLFKNKLETFVDFPIDELDLSNHVIHKNNKASCRYMLYAVSNHYGGMGGGHYTAFSKHGLNRWYEFDDSHVSPVTEEKVKTPAAYVLFYKRL